MKSKIGGSPTSDGSTRSPVPTDEDRSLLLAIAAWDNRTRPQPQGDTLGSAAGHRIPVFFEHLAPALFEKLCTMSVSEPGFNTAVEPSSALSQLRQMHAATARVDLARVHPSWWIRALQEESPAVRRAVAASFPPASRHQVQAGLLLDSRDLRSERPALPEVMQWILSLWSERLVGGEDERADDPPAIIVLSRLSLRTGYRLCRVAGLYKVLLANRLRELTLTRSINRGSIGWAARWPVPTSQCNGRRSTMSPRVCHCACRGDGGSPGSVC